MFCNCGMYCFLGPMVKYDLQRIIKNEWGIGPPRRGVVVARKFTYDFRMEY